MARCTGGDGGLGGIGRRTASVVGTAAIFDTGVPGGSGRLDGASGGAFFGTGARASESALAFASASETSFGGLLNVAAFLRVVVSLCGKSAAVASLHDLPALGGMM